MSTADVETNPNPYAPPSARVEQPSHKVITTNEDLLKACKYYKRVGWFSVVYIAFVGFVALVTCLIERPTFDYRDIGVLIGMFVMPAAMLLLFTRMIRIAKSLPSDFERLYGRARWLGILTGCFGFPILTIPAFIAVSRLANCRQIRDEKPQ